MRLVEGVLRLPDVLWECPRCTRVVAEGNDTRGGARLGGRMCAGDPRTGRPHRPVDLELRLA